MGKELILDKDFILEDSELGSQVDLRKVFGNDRPVEVEIGCGKGRFLLYVARSQPERNFLGIEWASKFYKFSADRIRRWNLRNVKLLRTDAREFFIDRLVSDSIDVVHVYFPDPWPKKKHLKRRLFIPEFCQALARVLVEGGKVYVSTDHEEYYQMIRTNLLAVDKFEECGFGSPVGSDVLTNYEDKWRRMGRDIWRLAVRKK